MKNIVLCMLVCCFFLNSKAQDNRNNKPQDGGAQAVQQAQAWQKLSVDKFSKLLADTTVQLVDVRTPDEYRGGHIPGARNIDVKSVNFDGEIGKLDPKRPVAVYCRSGMRSTAAAMKLTQKGFKVYELEKGINSWTGKQEK